MPGEQRVRELRQHGVVVADDTVDERALLRERPHRVRADLFLDGTRLPTAGAEVSEGCGTAHAAEHTLRPGEPSVARFPAGEPVAVRGARTLPNPISRRRSPNPTATTARGSASSVPHHWRAEPAFAEQRRTAAVPPPLRTAAIRRADGDRRDAGSSSSTASSTTATCGSTANTSARPRDTSPRTRSRSRDALRDRDRARARDRGRVPAATRPDREADDHRRLLAVAGVRPGAESGRDLATGAARVVGPGAHRSRARAVRRRVGRARPARVQRHARRRRRAPRSPAARGRARTGRRRAARRVAKP